MIEWELPLRLAHKASYLMAMQELSGVCFDVEAGQALAQRIREEMQAIRQEVEPRLPTRQLNKTEAREYCFRCVFKSFYEIVYCSHNKLYPFCFYFEFLV